MSIGSARPAGIYCLLLTFPGCAQGEARLKELLFIPVG